MQLLGNTVNSKCVYSYLIISLVECVYNYWDILSMVNVHIAI